MSKNPLFSNSNNEKKNHNTSKVNANHKEILQKFCNYYLKNHFLVSRGYPVIQFRAKKITGL